MTPSQLALVAGKARGIYDAAAKERQKASGGDRTSDEGNSGHGKSTITASARDEAGRAVGVSGKLVDYGTRQRVARGRVLMKERGELDCGNGGDRKSQSHRATVKLGELGITKSQSSRYQQEASVGIMATPATSQTDSGR